MSKTTQPYAIIQRRIDVVTRVPAWAEGSIQKGAEVIRLDAETVMQRLGQQPRAGGGADQREDRKSVV